MHSVRRLSSTMLALLSGSVATLVGCANPQGTPEETLSIHADAVNTSSTRTEADDPWVLPEEPCDPTVLVVRFDEGTGGQRCAEIDQINGVVERLGMQARRVHACSTLEPLRRSLDAVDGGAELLADLTMTYLLETTNGSPLTQSQLESLRELGFVQPEHSCPVSAMGMPDAPDEAKNEGAKSYEIGTGWHALQTGLGVEGGAVQQVKRLSRRGLPLVRVAVLDSGIDRSVPAPALLNSEVGWSFEQDAYGIPASAQPWLNDDVGHGTAVASLVGESSVGLAELVSVKVLNAKGKGSQTSLATGILTAAVDLNAKVLNLSLAFPKRTSRGYGKPWAYLLQPLAAAYVYGARTFSAAGNTCGNPNVSCEEFFPAAVEDGVGGVFNVPIKMTSVSGVAPDMGPSSQAVTCNADIAAPSEQVCAWNSSKAVWPGYQRGSGTSFAVPQAVGAMALIVSITGASTAAQLDDARALLLANTNRIRLDYCRILKALGADASTCVSWNGFIDPAEGACAAQSAPDAELSISYSDVYAGVEQAGYPASQVYTDGSSTAKNTPIEQGCDAVWCSGIFSAPSTPVCTSCDFCTNVSASEFRLSLQLGADLSMYTGYQLRLTTKLGTYIYFDLPNLGAHAGETLNVTGSVNGPGPGPDSDREAYLMAVDAYGKWTGTPMMKVNCPN